MTPHYDARQADSPSRPFRRPSQALVRTTPYASALNDSSEHDGADPCGPTPHVSTCLIKAGHDCAARRFVPDPSLTAQVTSTSRAFSWYGRDRSCLPRHSGPVPRVQHTSDHLDGAESLSFHSNRLGRRTLIPLFGEPVEALTTQRRPSHSDCTALPSLQRAPMPLDSTVLLASSCAEPRRPAPVLHAPTPLLAPWPQRISTFDWTRQHSPVRAASRVNPDPLDYTARTEPDRDSPRRLVAPTAPHSPHLSARHAETTPLDTTTLAHVRAPLTDAPEHREPSFRQATARLADGTSQASVAPRLYRTGQNDGTSQCPHLAIATQVTSTTARPHSSRRDTPTSPSPSRHHRVAAGQVISTCWFRPSLVVSAPFDPPRQAPTRHDAARPQHIDLPDQLCDHFAAALFDVPERLMSRRPDVASRFSPRLAASYPPLSHRRVISGRVGLSCADSDHIDVPTPRAKTRRHRSISHPADVPTQDSTRPFRTSRLVLSDLLGPARNWPCRLASSRRVKASQPISFRPTGLHEPERTSGPISSDRPVERGPLVPARDGPTTLSHTFRPVSCPVDSALLISAVRTDISDLASAERDTACQHAPTIRAHAGLVLSCPHDRPSRAPAAHVRPEPLALTSRFKSRRASAPHVSSSRVSSTSQRTARHFRSCRPDFARLSSTDPHESTS